MAATPGKVKDKRPAEVQITAEQLIREAWERQQPAPGLQERIHFADSEELRDHQRVKRKEFEDKIIRNRSHVPLWLRYAKWEETQNEYARARSVYERAIDYDHRTHVVWLHYAEMEMRAGFVNHARNVWDRAVAVLPRVAQLWLRYAYMEEVLGRIDLARLVFRRWVEWHPEPSAYTAFAKFELRNDNADNARAVFELFVSAHPATATYLKFARFEEKHGNVAKARKIYERASEELPLQLRFATLYKAFAAFEERHKQYERARAIYKFAVENLPEKYAEEVGAAYTAFEKQRGGGQQLENVLLEKRRAEYEKAIAEDSADYDAWFDLTALEEAAGDVDRTRKTFDRAVSNSPKLATKRAWQRYIYLWLRYACWEELGAKDPERAAQVYQHALAVIPKKHKLFSFGKLWLAAAELEIRRKNVPAARKILGHALGVLPNKHSLYKDYIRIECTLTEVDRARKLHRLWIERNPTVAQPYVEFAAMEEQLGELARARQIFEIALGVEHMDMPEAVWKAYIDLEIEAEEVQNAVALYERMLKINKSLSVWLSYANLVAENHTQARDIYKRAYRALKERVVDEGKASPAREDAAKLADVWLEFETKYGDDEQVAEVKKLAPLKNKRKRPILDSRGNEAGEEEVVEWIFPDEQVKKPKLRLLQVAKNWKKKQQDNI